MEWGTDIETKTELYSPYHFALGVIFGMFANLLVLFLTKSGDLEQQNYGLK